MTRLLYAGPPLRVLHEEYANNGRIDQDAPVTAAYEVDIRALWEVRALSITGAALALAVSCFTWRAWLTPGGETPPGWPDSPSSARSPAPCSPCPLAA